MKRLGLPLSLMLLAALVGCATTAASADAGSAAEQLTAFVGDFLRQALAAYLT